MDTVSNVFVHPLFTSSPDQLRRVETPDWRAVISRDGKTVRLVPVLKVVSSKLVSA